MGARPSSSVGLSGRRHGAMVVRPYGGTGVSHHGCLQSRRGRSCDILSIYLTPALFCCFLAFLRTAPGTRSTTNETRRPLGSTPLAPPSDGQTAQRKAGGSIQTTPAVGQQRRATLVEPRSRSGNVSLIQAATIVFGRHRPASLSSIRRSSTPFSVLQL